MRIIEAEPGTSLLAVLQSAGFYLPAACGGRGNCGKCAVKTSEGRLPPSVADSRLFSPAELDNGWRLACTAFPCGDLVVEIPETGEGSHAGDFFCVNNFTPDDRLHYRPADAKLPNAAEPPEYGIAVDIGTTTLGFALITLNNGYIAARFAELNRQRAYGGDVISRIHAANNGGIELLSQCIRRQLSDCITALCAGAGVAPCEIKKIAIAGNTVMLHLLLGLSCRSLGTAPFTPVTLEMLARNCRGLLGEPVPEGLDCEAVILPGISTYVGADITAGIFFTGLHRREKTAALVDIGTNGEMVLVHKDRIFCTATAAGPAFEGGNILWGTGGVPGAITRVQFLSGEAVLAVIGDRPPLGICGSGVVSLAYQGLKHGLILPSGRFSEQIPPEGIFLAKTPDGRDIVFCQKDVRELQLAKSAIRTGLDFLLEQAGLDYGDIDNLYIAGGFGFNLDLESAAGIGLIPSALTGRVTFTGNSALGGAVRCLLESGGEEILRDIAKRATELRLPGDARFNERFVQNLDFDR